MTLGGLEPRRPSGNTAIHGPRIGCLLLCSRDIGDASKAGSEQAVEQASFFSEEVFVTIDQASADFHGAGKLPCVMKPPRQLHLHRH